MDVPCVRVTPADGEATRQRLAESDLIHDEYQISAEAGWLYIPITDPEAVPEELPVTDWSPPERDRQTTPADILGFSPSYERIGDIALLEEADPDRAREIARAIVDSDLPLQTVLNQASKIKGERRVREWEVLAGEGTETVHREYGCAFALDLADVYFSPRLATERHRVAEQVRAGEQAFDMFAGVGPFVIPFAKRGATCVGCDINERAIEYLERNARRNGVTDRMTALCDDVRAVIAGNSAAGGPYLDWADRIVMNLPHSADAFLEHAVSLAGEDCVIHYYDIQHEDDPFGPGERAIREAVAANETEYTVTVENRRNVRSYAPHELNVCLDVRLER